MSANISVGAKYYGSKSLLITNKLSAVMLRPSNIGMHPNNQPSATSNIKNIYIKS